MSRPRLLNLRAKIIAAMAVVGLVVVAASVAVSGWFRYGEILAEFQTFVRSAAGTTALAIDAQDLDRIHGNDDARGPAFARVRAILEQSRRINGLAEDQIYILRSAPGDPFKTEFVVMLQQDTFVGDQYVIPEANRDHLLRAWQTSMPQSTGLYSDENGRWISAYAPILDARGNPVAMLEVDANLGAFLNSLLRDLLVAAGAGLAALVLAMIPGILLANRITLGLARLTAGMRDFHAGKPDVCVDVRTGDEIEDLGSVFNEMIQSLAEKLALLPYVSRFTAEAVRRSRTDPAWLTGSEQDVTVLFADLRGFTRFSEAREASVLVLELNRLLAVQADVVTSAGGDVDKFIGDAVMAVFLHTEGQGARVLECAQRLVQRVREETARSGWQLGLGIGIHTGSAVVGSIGSETRRDFTAIGHTVNLASRLCDRAGQWEILASKAFHDALPPDARRAFRETEPMHFKNVSEPVITFSCVVDPAPQASGFK